MNKKILIYSDESRRKKGNGGQGKFEALCAISFPEESLDHLSNELKKHLNEHNIGELKFVDVRTHKPKVECCKKFIDTAIEFASKGLIRVDVVIWDLSDSRHNIQGRNDKANLERMYFHLLRNVSERWNIFDCEFYPDENSEYDYEEIRDYLNSTKTPRIEPGLLTLFKQERKNFNFLNVKSQNSKNNCIIQLCDVFVGIGRFSRENSNEYKIWNNQRKSNNQPTFFNNNDITEENGISKSNYSRFKLIEYLAEKCKKKGIIISLNTNNYLKSYDNKFPINFWHYEPQGNYDKAPTN